MPKKPSSKKRREHQVRKRGEKEYERELREALRKENKAREEQGHFEYGGEKTRD
jgi:hypothetical protein